MRSVRAVSWRAVALILLLGMLGGSLGGLVGYARAQQHEAEAVVLVTPLEGNPFSPTGNGDDLINLQTEAELMASDAVGTLVARRLEGDATAREVRAGLSVDVPPNTQILQITYEAGSVDSAIDRAQAYAVEYLAFRRDRAAALLEQRRERTRSQLAEQQGELERLNQQLGNTQNPGRKSVLQNRIDGANAQLETLQVQLAQISLGSLEPGQVVTPAAVAGGLVDLRRPVLLLGGVGLLAGMGLAVVVLVVRSRTRGAVRAPADVEAAGVPVLGTVPAALMKGDGPASGGAATWGEDISLDPGLAELRANVLAWRPVTLLVGAAAPGAQADGVARSVAMASAMSGVTTMLLELSATPGPEVDDGDTAESSEEPGPEAAESPPPSAGLVDVLRGTATLDEALIEERPYLWVLPVGTTPGRLENLVLSPAAEHVMRDCADRATVVVVAVDSVHDPAARGLARVTDATLLEVVEGRHRMSDVRRAVGFGPPVESGRCGAVVLRHGRPGRRVSW